MFINFIYLIIFLILTFVLVIAVKAITRGIEAKQNIKEEKLLDDNKNEDVYNLANEIQKINKLHSDGILNDDEFKKAKEKILK
tara:strand:- start:18 stop:266 length:249 start_codon:yes stop_codon:yes gene_type:complete